MPIRHLQPSFAGGELAPSLYGRVDLAKFQVGLRRARNVFVHPHGGVSNRAGLAFVCELKNSCGTARLIPFSFNTEQTYILEFGDYYMRVIKDGAQVVETARHITTISRTNPVVVTAPGHGCSPGQEVFITGAGGMTQINGRTFVVRSTGETTITLDDKGGEAIDGTAYDLYTGGGTVSRIYEISTPYAAVDLRRLKFVQSADVIYLVHPGYAPRKLSRTGHAAWTLSTITFAPSITAPTGFKVVATGTGKITYRYKLTAIAAETGEESLPTTAVEVANQDLGVANQFNTLSWQAAAGASKYLIYKEKNGVYGFIGATDQLTFRDGDTTYDAPDVTDTPPNARNPFAAAGDYPGTATFFEQRLCYAQSTANPQRVWMSTSANFENFNVSDPVKDDDAVTVTLAARQVNEIRHMIPLSDLIILTSGGEWRLTGGDTGYVTPANVLVRPQSYRGAAHVPPIVVGNSILFVEEKGSGVRDLGYSFEVDGYTGNDLSVLAPHLFEGREIVEWAYAQEPHSLIWCVRDDGKMLSLTYMKEHEIWAWSWHDTVGAFESVASIGEEDEDAVYVIVKRALGGRPVRTIERLHRRRFEAIEDAFFLDCALAYDGPATPVLGGLWHLEGETVTALADGNVVRDVPVRHGRVQLPVAASKAVVGLSYGSEIRTLPLDLAAPDGGTAGGRRKRVARVVLRLERTRGIFVGPDAGRLVEYKQRGTEALGTPIEPFTGDIEMTIPAHWQREGDVTVVQNDPLPMTILGVMPDVEIGR